MQIFVQIRRIDVHPDYRGYSRSYVADIAIVWIKDAAVFTPFVRPVCVDWQNNFEREQLAQGNIGQVKTRIYLKRRNLLILICK